MTWNEFKNYIDSKLTDKEKDYPICYIDLLIYSEIGEINIYTSDNQITINS